MNDGTRFILSVLRQDFAPGAMIQEANWQDVVVISRKHRLGALLMHNLSRLDDHRFAKLRNQLRTDHFEVAKRYVALRDAQQTLSAALGKRQIPSLFFKGLSIAALYPLPHLRAMNDLDLLIRPKDRSRVHTLLMNTGHELVKKTLNEWIYRKDGLLLEVHIRLIHPSDTTPVIARYFDQAGSTALEQGQALSALESYVFLLVHLIKHLEGTGAGWRFLVDLAYARKNLDLDEVVLRDTTEDLQISTFSLVVDGLLERCFGLSLSSQADQTRIDRLEAMMDGEGLFGHQDKLLAKAYRLRKTRHRASWLKRWFWPQGLTKVQRLSRLSGWVLHPKQALTKFKSIRGSKNQADAWLDDLREIGL